MPKGISTNKNCTSIADCLARNFDFVIRYYCAGTSSKKMGINEAKALCAAGSKLAAVYENNPTKISYFNGNAGHADGVDAYHYAQLLHQAAASAIYFTVDNDFSESQIAGPINDYFAGIVRGFKDAAAPQTAVYRIGVYGSGLCCQWLKAHNPAVELTWLAESSGWSGSKNYADWNLKQSFMKESVCGLKVDPRNPDNNDAELNDSQGDFGDFSVPT